MSLQANPPRLRLRPEALIFIGALLVRLWVVSRFTGTPYSALQMGDMKFYHDWAVRILRGNGTDGHAFYGLPGYAFLLAGFYGVLGTDFPIDWLVVGAVQSVLEALTAVLIFKIATHLCECEREISPAREKRSLRDPAVIAGCAASAAYVFFVPAQAFSIILMPTAWLVCLFWFCVWKAMSHRGEGLFHPWSWLGLLVGLMAMIIATIFFVLPLLLWGLWRQVAASLPWRQRVGRASLATLLLFGGVLAGTAPAWYYNHRIAHDPVWLSAHGGLNFWMGNNPGATGYPKIPEGLRPSQDGLLRDSIKWAEDAAGHPLPRSEVSRFWSAKANAYIREHPGEWLHLVAVKVRNFWNAFQYDDISVITLFRERGVVLPGLSFGLVAAGGLAGLLLGIWGNRPARWVGAAVLLHMGALLSVFITERYRLAAAPGLIVLSVYVGWRLWRVLAKGEWRAAAAIAALLALTTTLAFWPTRDPALWAVEPYNVAVKEMEVAEGLASAPSPECQGAAAAEFAHARKHLERAYALLPGNPGICFAMGNWWFDHGNRNQAREWYERTLQLNPKYASALKNLGSISLDARLWQEADRLLSAAHALDPDNATTCYLIARAKIGLGDVEAARSVLNDALRMKPTQPEFLALQQQLAAPAPPP